MAEGSAQLRLAVVGISESAVCGVRDHSQLLAGALAQADMAISCHWLYRTGRSFWAPPAGGRAWSRRLAARLGGRQPAALRPAPPGFAHSPPGAPPCVPG